MPVWGLIFTCWWVVGNLQTGITYFERGQICL